MRGENRLLHAHFIVAEEHDSIALEALRWETICMMRGLTNGSLKTVGVIACTAARTISGACPKATQISAGSERDLLGLQLRGVHRLRHEQFLHGRILQRRAKCRIFLYIGEAVCSLRPWLCEGTGCSGRGRRPAHRTSPACNKIARDPRRSGLARSTRCASRCARKACGSSVSACRKAEIASSYFLSPKYA